MLPAETTVADPVPLEPVAPVEQPRHVGRRLAGTLVANAARSLIALGAGIVVAQGLGASGYGDLMFLLGSFVAVSQLTDLGASTAFYTFLSRRKRGRTFLTLYFMWLLAQALIPAAVIGLVFPDRFVRATWVGHERWIVVLAFAANFFMSQAWAAVTQLGEAARRTLLVQFAATVPVALHLVIVRGITLWGHLTVPLVLWLLVAEYALTAIVLAPRLLRDNLAHQADETWPNVAREFMQYP